MSSPHPSVDACVGEIDRLRRMLKKKTTAQVKAAEERSLIKAVCLAWFNHHRPLIAQTLDESILVDADDLYRQMLTASDRATTRQLYDQTIVQLRRSLSKIRGFATEPRFRNAIPTSDKPPTFSPLVLDVEMQLILERRWKECSKCIAAGAPLAAVVMMGGLLEALLLARILKEPTPTKVEIFKAATAPKDRVTGKTLPLKEWTLRHYIDVAHELDWITSSAKDIGEVVRDYRNFIHPQKELSHGIKLGDGDAQLFWEIAKSITRQLLK